MSVLKYEIDMINNKGFRIFQRQFEKEDRNLTLEFTFKNYDLTGKSVSVVFEPNKIEIPVAQVDGVISLPVEVGYLSAGNNALQVMFRWDNKLDQSGIINWYVDKSL